MNEWMREYAAVRVAGVFSFSFPHSFSRCVRVSYSCSANQCCVRGESILTQYSCELSCVWTAARTLLSVFIVCVSWTKSSVPRFLGFFAVFLCSRATRSERFSIGSHFLTGNADAQGRDHQFEVSFLVDFLYTNSALGWESRPYSWNSWMNFWFTLEYYDFSRTRHQSNFSHFALSCSSSSKFVDVLDTGTKDF